jgi:hypothetical protein
MLTGEEELVKVPSLEFCLEVEPLVQYYGKSAFTVSYIWEFDRLNGLKECEYEFYS